MIDYTREDQEIRASGQKYVYAIGAFGESSIGPIACVDSYSKAIALQMLRTDSTWLVRLGHRSDAQPQPVAFELRDTHINMQILLVRSGIRVQYAPVDDSLSCVECGQGVAKPRKINTAVLPCGQIVHVLICNQCELMFKWSLSFLVENVAIE